MAYDPKNHAARVLNGFGDVFYDPDERIDGYSQAMMLSRIQSEIETALRKAFEEGVKSTKTLEGRVNQKIQDTAAALNRMVSPGRER